MRRTLIMQSIARRKSEPEKCSDDWCGFRVCDNCLYQWKSRKNTPPRRCPDCSSRNISTLKGSCPYVGFERYKKEKISN
jgi:predicted Zn-ribbon and HTH transcriptional regulator